MPPPPIPWTDLPARRTAGVDATEAMIVPIVKMTRAQRRTGLRPKMWLKEAQLGWKTVDVRRKEVPAQKASMAVPEMEVVMVCGDRSDGQLLYCRDADCGRGIEEGLTGRATERMDASIAQTRLMTQRQTKDP
jgi:hypothetical protein